MDIEQFTRRRILKGSSEKKIVGELASAIKEFKGWSEKKRREFSEAVYGEVKTTLQYKKLKDPFLRRLIEYPKAGVSMGEFGVGSRGEGDFFVHKKISEVIGKTTAVVDSREQDDAGVVRVSMSGTRTFAASERMQYVTVAIDGMHSRLSEFPFLAGFHAARAALRDVYVMGSMPTAMISDMHLADDGDVGKLFDFTAGVSTVAELTKVPLVSGSTLRIGGDMVFGDRLVCAVGAVGVSNEKPKARKNAAEGDVILATEGSGGGTITTIALYNNSPEVVKETLNVDFMKACNTLAKSGIEVHAMTDVTNGGLRGDASEIAASAGKKLVFYEDGLEKTVNEKVLAMLEELKIDYLGISTDSLMLILPEESVARVIKLLKKVTKVYKIGHVENGRGASVIGDGEREFSPLFRESAYTNIKKVVGERTPENVEALKKRINDASLAATLKKEEVSKYVLFR